MDVVFHNTNYSDTYYSTKEEGKMKGEKVLSVLGITLVLLGLVSACVSCYYAGKSAGNMEIYEELSERGLIKE